MFEMIGFLTVGVLVFGLAVLAFKLLFGLILLPLKLGLWVFKGALGLILIVPAAIVAVCLATSVLPILVLIVAIPVVACIGIIACLFA